MAEDESTSPEPAEAFVFALNPDGKLSLSTTIAQLSARDLQNANVVRPVVQHGCTTPVLAQ
jgi:hypothetical protein